ncbi:MAG TPA: hypothetical protein VJM15_11120 [Sphingomicrobium sp.]|nr:hypothetical protein [Sphingomicrobium sp.]
MDDRFAPQPIAPWYTAAAACALLFMVVGCALLLLDLSASRASMALDQRAVHDARPLWIVVANAVAMLAGALGALLLVMRRKLAEPVLFGSLVAVILWLAGLLLTPDLRDLLSTNDIAVALSVTLVTWTIFWFARHSRQRGWLR